MINKGINFTWLLAFGLLLGWALPGCGGGTGTSGCAGTTFVNQSITESVIVAQSSTSGITFGTFTLEAGESNEICGDDDNGIGGEYTWPNADTASLGQTWSGGDFCIYLTSSHTATSGNCP